MIEVRQQEETNVIKSHGQLPMYNTVMEGKAEGKPKLSPKDTGDKRLHIQDMERMHRELVCTAGRVQNCHALYSDFLLILMGTLRSLMLEWTVCLVSRHGERHV